MRWLARSPAASLLALLALGCASSGEKSPPPSEPFTAIGVSEGEAEFGKTYLPLTRRFGFTEYVHAARAAGGSTLYEYLPEGETLEGWNHLATLLLHRVAGSWEEGAKALPRYRDAFLAGLPLVQESLHAPGAQGGASYLRYQTGGGPLTEHALAVVWQVLPGTMATFQVQQRSEPFAQRQKDEFVELVYELALARAPDPRDADTQANAVTLLWMESCLKHPGRNEAVSDWAREKGLRPTSAAFSSALLQGAEGEVWSAADSTGEYAVVLTDPFQCALWARRANAELVIANFEKLITGMHHPRLELVRMHDRHIEGAGGTYRQIVYFAKGEGNETGFIFLCTTTGSEDAEFQAKLTVSRARRSELAP